jgi:hypothetical protein
VTTIVTHHRHHHHHTYNPVNHYHQDAESRRTTERGHFPADKEFTTSSPPVA